MKTLDQQITLHQQAVGLEFFDSLSTYVKRFNDIRLFAGLKSRLNEIFSNGDYIEGYIQPTVNPKVIKWLTDVGYPNLKQFTVYVPLSLSSNVSQYLDVLEDNNRVLSTIDAGLLTPATNLFGMLLNQPELLNSKSPIVEQITKADLFNVDIDKLKGSIAKCFDKNAPSDQMTFTRAYSRIGDLESAAKRISAMQDNIGRSGIETVRQKSDAMFDTAMALAKEFKSNSNYSNVSKKISDQIAQYLFKCALWIELYGVHIQQLTIMAAAIKDTSAKVLKASK